MSEVGRRATLIYNSAAGSADGARLREAQECLRALLPVDLCPVEPGQDPARLAEEAVAAGSTVLVAFGGDGTVSAVASAVVGRPDITLGILPGGTANSIASCLDIPGDVSGACEVIGQGHRRCIDSAEVDGRAMVLLATIGVHADSVAGVDPDLKRNLGPLAYAWEEVTRLFSDERFEVSLHANAQSWHGLASGVTVANLAPKINLLAQGTEAVDAGDGVLDVTVVAIDGVIEAVGTAAHLAMQLISEQPADRGNVVGFRTTEIRIETREPRQVMVDGDYVGTTPVTVRIQPRSLCVFAPRPQDRASS